MGKPIIVNEKGKSYQLDTSMNRITMLDGRFYYDGEGNAVPSVTTLLDAYPKGPQYYKWLKENGSDADEIMTRAGDRGSNVHNMTEQYDKGEKVELLDQQGSIPMSMLEWAMFERYVDLTKRFSPQHEMVEQNFVSSRLGWAGTIDRPITFIPFLNKRVMIDIKTGPTIYDHYWLQGAAYRELMKDMIKKDVDDFAILHLNAKIRTENPKEIQGIGWKLYTPPKPHKYYLDLFQSTRKLWHALNDGLVPKEVTYQLSHFKTPPEVKSKTATKKR